MDDSLIFIIVGLVVVVGFVVMKRAGQVSTDVARKLIEESALIVDVRSQGEFQSDHLPNAINIPLGELKERISTVCSDKSRPVLVHCLSGGRSAMARSVLKGMGYTNVHNLGSLTRARHVVAAA